MGRRIEAYSWAYPLFHVLTGQREATFFAIDNYNPVETVQED